MKPLNGAALSSPLFQTQVPRQSLRLAILAIAFAGALLSPMSERAEASPAAKTEALSTLRTWRSRVIAEDEKSSSAQKKSVTALARLRLTPEAERELETSLSEILRIDNERVEIEAQRRIIDQLIFAVDTKWSGSDLRGFLEVQLLDFAVNDLSEPGQGGWWKFLIQAAISLREAEPGADPIKFLEAYTHASGVLEPKSAFEVLKTRDYVGE